MKPETLSQAAPPPLLLQAEVGCPFVFAMEVGVVPAGAAPDAFTPLHHEDVTADLADLVDEAVTRGVLAGHLEPGSAPAAITIGPEWTVEPVVDRIRVAVAAGTVAPYEAEFREGRWTRRAVETLRRLRAEERLTEDDKAYVRVVALRDANATLELSPVQVPEVTDQPLAELGVRELGSGELDPDRPVLVNARAVDEILERTVEAGFAETGGGMLGKIVRLPEPLEGTRTPVVTVLTAGVADGRHEGAPGRLSFSAEALVDAARIAELRGRGEAVLTAYHTHGWGKDCNECNHSAACALPSVELVSADDYQVLDSLFPAKSTVMPIAGRRLGAAGKRPVLAIHAWSGGAMRPVGWRTYTD